MRNKHDFSLLYKKIKVSASKIESISAPVIPRKRREPNYSILHYVSGSQEATAVVHYPENPYEYYKSIYYKALDSIVNAMKDRSDQPTFKLFTQTEQMFLIAVRKQDVTNESKVQETHFKGDYDTTSLTSELQLFPTIFECEPINLEK